MSDPASKFLLLVFLCIAQQGLCDNGGQNEYGSTQIADRHGGGGNGGHDHHDQPSNYNPAPAYDTWSYDWSRPSIYTPAPLPEIHPYVPGNQYRPLFPESRLPPEVPDYPSTTLYVPTFTMTTDTPIINLGEDIHVTIQVEKGSPPYTVYWLYDDDNDWTTGTLAFTKTANRRGVITISAIVKDLNNQISLINKIQIVVLRKPE